MYSRDKILEKIVEFQNSHFNLVAIDAVTAISGVGAATLLTTLSAGYFPWVLVAAAATFYSGKFTQRDHYVKKFNEQLSDLQQCYKKYCESNRQDITSDETFLKLLETIAPFTFTKDGKSLLPNHRIYSSEFKQILS